jgi:large subunit ribosomal protein L21
MYAIIEDGSHQYRVEEGSVVIIDYREVKEGDVLELNKVLLIGSGDQINIGQPLVAGAKVMAEVIGFPRTKTVTQYFRRRKNSKKLRGHTQPHLRVKVTSIVKA